MGRWLATGEEAYSLAILLHEHLTRLNRPINAKIFATDVHQASLDIAGTGCYDEERLAEVSPERLKNYFSRKGQQYQVSAELRQMIVFAQHNILKDAPFTRLDLVSCRNLLIYFEPAAQKRALSLFHFGLKANSVLMLGPSEGLAGLEEEFSVLNRQWKVFRKRRDSRLPADVRLPMPISSLPALQPTTAAKNARRSSHDGALHHVYDALLDSCVPSGLLLNYDRELVHVFGDAGKYLHHSAGKSSSDVIDLLEPDLRTALSGALQRASKRRATVSYSAVAVSNDSQAAKIKLMVCPLAAQGQGISHFLLTFETLEQNAGLPAEPLNIGEVSKERIADLELELRTTKENLQATIEELEASNEELHATNEELVASNEELQSTNEELHSVNEELYTVNAEYQRKISELTELTDDMENLLASTDVGVLFLDRELCIRKLTPRIAKVFNTLTQDVGRSFETFSNNLRGTDLTRDIRWVRDTGQTIEKEVQDRFNNWYLLKVLPYQSTADIDGVVVTLIDIATLKKAEEELRDREEKLQGILDHAPAFIYVKDLEGRYTLANRRAKSVLGTKGLQLVGKTDYEVLPRNVADHIESHDRHVATTGEILQIEETIPKKGKGITYLSIKYPLRDKSGRIFAVAGIATNITRRKIAETRARQAVKHRDRFLAMLSHELRNPLAAIKNGVEVLSRFPLEDPTAHKASEAISTQADQMTRLMGDLLDISRITQGKIELTTEVIDLCEVAKRSAAVVRSMMAERHHEFVTEFPRTAIYVDADAARLQQVQVNLLVNAAKYTPGPGIVRFTIASEDATALIRVSDTGLGMSEELQRRAFDPFFQADNTLGHSEGGMGVGLTLVQSLVDLHGGDIQVFSSGRGKGSEFVVRIPLATVLPTESSRHISDCDAPPDLKILLVEDNEQLRYTTQTLLELDGYDVTSASDGLAALTAMEMRLPDVAIIDIGLPELDGYAVARRIRLRDSSESLYLVVLTGYGQESDKKRALKAGFDQHLTKPINMNVLRNLFRELADRQSGKNKEPIGESE